MKIVDNFRSLLFCSHTFSVRRSIDLLDPENQPGFGSAKIRTGSGALGRTEDVETKKKDFKNMYNTYSFHTISKISLRLRYKAPDPVFGLNRIHTTENK